MIQLLPVDGLAAVAATALDRDAVTFVAQAGGADGGVSSPTVWVGLLVLLVIFVFIVLRAFGQKRRALEAEDERAPEPDEPAEAPGPSQPSLKEIKRQRAARVADEGVPKEALVRARQARKGASRGTIVEAEDELHDETESTSPATPRIATPTEETAPQEPAPEDVTGEAASAEETPAEKTPAGPPAKTLIEGLAKTRGGFVSRLKGVFSRRKTLDSELVAELEEVLLTADIGIHTSTKLLEAVQGKLTNNGEVSSDQVWTFLRDETARILHENQRPLRIGEERPFVILVIGVNGVGKTTTIGKLASRLRGEGHKVLLVAGDTFRAAAIDQLKVWGERTQCDVFAGEEQSDPSAVVFDGLKHAAESGIDVVLVDTAGRLHTKVNLVEELKKIRRVADKALPGSPHEVLLVLDANTGQNAINQAEMFGKEIGVTGIALTKLDGTAKGGVVIGICDELSVPVQFIGIGEQVEDLREFDADEFVEAVF